MENINENEMINEPVIKIKKTPSDYVRKWQAKNPEKMKQYREVENIRRREKRRLLRILRDD
jgi:hypothetical protein